MLVVDLSHAEIWWVVGWWCAAHSPDRWAGSSWCQLHMLLRHYKPAYPTTSARPTPLLSAHSSPALIQQNAFVFQPKIWRVGHFEVIRGGVVANWWVSSSSVRRTGSCYRYPVTLGCLTWRTPSVTTDKKGASEFVHIKRKDRYISKGMVKVLSEPGQGCHSWVVNQVGRPMSACSSPEIEWDWREEELSTKISINNFQLTHVVLKSV